MTVGLRTLFRTLLRQRRSITRQISLLFALISLFVIAAIGFNIDRMLSNELLAANDALLLGNMVLIRDRLSRYHSANAIVANHRFVEETGVGYRKLALAVLDEHRRILQASDEFDVPIAALPEAAIPIDALPEIIDNASARELEHRFAKTTRQWIAPDGSWYQVLLARMPLPETDRPGDDPPHSVLLALSYDRSLPRELLARYRKGLLETLIVSVLASAALGVWAARMVLKRVKRMAATASRISAHALNKRLPLDDAPEELLDSAIAFNQMLDRLEDSFKRLSEFSSDLAHDLRTPINNLLGEAQVALSRPRSADDYRAVLESAVEEYERLSRMIENMLFLARADNAQARAAPQWIALRKALGNMLSYYELLAEERGIRLRLEVRSENSGEPRVWADELMLGRAVSNLLSNALRHSPPGSVITVRAIARADGSAEIGVANPGAGIAPEHLPRIFDRFYRARSAREDSASGSGLGLAIVKSIAELHGGTIDVKSTPGVRTVFTLTLPAASY